MRPGFGTCTGSLSMRVGCRKRYHAINRCRSPQSTAGAGPHLACVRAAALCSSPSQQGRSRSHAPARHTTCQVRAAHLDQSDVKCRRWLIRPVSLQVDSGLCVGWSVPAPSVAHTEDSAARPVQGAPTLEPRPPHPPRPSVARAPSVPARAGAGCPHDRARSSGPKLCPWARRAAESAG